MNLPAPDPAFCWSAEPWGHVLRCRPLESVTQHLFTTRQRQLPVSRVQDQHSPEDVSNTPVVWMQAAASLGAGLAQVMRIKQVHGRTVRVLRQGEIGLDDVASRPDADAIVSNAEDVVLAVQVADCVPLLMADARTGAAAAVHAGWRGTALGIAAAAIDAMAREFGTRPRDLTVAVGPSIGACCYEVGPELVEGFRAAGSSDEQLSRWLMRSDAGSLRLDLWMANRDQIHAAGVPDDRIHFSALCTRTHSDVFDSYRAEGSRAGRMAALIRVPRLR